MKTTRRMSKILLLCCVLLVFLAAQPASAQTALFTDKAAFISATGATATPLPSSDQIGFSLSYDNVTITAPNAIETSFGDQGPWNITYDVPPLYFSLPGTTPLPASGIIAGNGEDDYLLTFATPVSGVGLSIITNFSANEIITLKDEAGNAILSQSIDSLTTPNSTVFVGFTSSTPIKSLFLETENGPTENEAIFEILQSGGFSISGKVLNANNNPITNVSISDNAGHTATTDSTGKYTLSGLPAGTYTITPSKSGYSFQPLSRSVSVPPDATGVDFTANDSSTISGHVSDSNNNPVAGVTLSDGAGNTATTDSNGDYTLTSEPAGTYTITPSKTGYSFQPLTRSVSVPPDATGVDFTAVGFSITADRASVWANGHQETKLTVRIANANGQGVPGHSINISADPSQEVSIKSVNTTTNAQGEAVFTATSTKVGTVKFIASDANNSSLTASTTVEFQRRKIVVQFLGIRTTLRCNPTTGACTPERDADNFATLRAVLQAQKGFQPEDFLWYSYTGGTVDPITGQRKTMTYNCEDTSRSYASDIIHLRLLIKDFGNYNPNTDFYLVGHSQGGLVAFQELGFLSEKPAKTSISAIITLDSPLGGSPRLPTRITQWADCWNQGRAPSQLIQLYETVPGRYRDQQGTRAQLLCALRGIDQCPSFRGIKNEGVARLIPTFTFGSSDDAVHHPAVCNVLIPVDPLLVLWNKFLALQGDNSSSQVVNNAMESGIFPLGGNVPRNSPRDFEACISSSHKSVFTLFSGRVAQIIGSQIGMP